jgi:hypothetical protein
MARWSDVEVAAPDLADVVVERFTTRRHHVLATLRRDGSPRLSGTEVMVRDGDLWLGAMAGSRKALDLRRDPRFALHAGPDDPDADDPSRWPGDAKVAGDAVEVQDPERQRTLLGATADTGAHLFRLELTEVVTVRVSDDATHLVLTLWTPDGGVRTLQRT